MSSIKPAGSETMPGSTMMIIDAQVHVWVADRPDRPWPTGGVAGSHRSVPLEKDELLTLMADAGVDRAVLVPPSWDGLRNDLSLEAAHAHPDRFAVMGRLPLGAPESPAALPQWRSNPHMLGLRYNFTAPTDRAMLTDGTADWLWPAAERHGVPLMLLAPHDLPVIGRIAARHPGLRLVIDHMAIPGQAMGDAAFEGLPDLLVLANHANIGVKASGLPSAATDAYPYHSVHGAFRQAFDAFGPKRVFWASDLTRLPCEYGDSVTMFTEAMPWLREDDKAWIMGRAIAAWLGWSGI
jgi:predicted TIM-barrel fold metal-dependent hydrolase